MQLLEPHFWVKRAELEAGRRHASKRGSVLSDTGKVTQENLGRSENDW